MAQLRQPGLERQTQQPEQAEDLVGGSVRISMMNLRAYDGVIAQQPAQHIQRLADDAGDGFGGIDAEGHTVRRTCLLGGAAS